MHAHSGGANMLMFSRCIVHHLDLATLENLSMLMYSKGADGLIFGHKYGQIQNI